MYKRKTLRPYKYYSKEQIQWIRENCRGLDYVALTAAFNSYFDTDLTEMQIRGVLYNYKIKTGAPRRDKYYPAGTISKDGKKIKTNKKEWETLYKYLRIEELKEAYKKKLKETDKKLYRQRFGPKSGRIDTQQVIDRLTKGE